MDVISSQAHRTSITVRTHCACDHTDAVLPTRIVSKQLQEFLVTKKLKKLDASKVSQVLWQALITYLESCFV